MAESEAVHQEDVKDDDTDAPGYKPPEFKPLEDMLKQDADDESLVKYKKALLGGGGDTADPFPNDPRRVIVTELALVVQDREDVCLDLTGDLSKLKEKVFTIKEGAQYKMRVKFYVQKGELVSGLKYVQKTYRKGIKGDLSKLKEQVFIIKEGTPYKMRVKFYVQKGELVSGLKYVQKTYRKGVKVDTSKFMVGSYAPKLEPQTWTTPVEDAPSGMIARGDYKVESLFTDDDNNEHLKWTWKFEIKKDWA